MKVFRVSGFHNSGKTVVVETIVRHLCDRGYSVATAKDIHSGGWTIDPDERKDTKRHALAGAVMVAITASEETVIIYPGQRKQLEDLFPLFDTDYLVIEGYASRRELPNITCIRTEAVESEIQQLVSPSTLAISGLISEVRKGDQGGIPIMNAHRDAKRLGDLVEKHAVEYEGGERA